MRKRTLLLLAVLFIVYELVVWGLSVAFFSEANYILAGILLTACGLTVLVVYVLVARLSAGAAQRSGQAAQEPPSPTSAAAPGTDEDADAIAAIIREANERLAKSPTLASQRVKSALTDFPLYLVCGAEGSGKTSAFLASKLEPELLAGQVYRDSAVVPTRLGNIWFARSAVIVEAGGGFFGGEPGRWNRFLTAFHPARSRSGLAKLFAPRAQTSLTSVVLCVDVGAFVGIPDSNRLAAMARLTQQRLRAAGEVFGRDFPVYVIFTKADSIHYFADFFGRLSESEDQQILGCTLPPAPAVQESAAGVYAETETGRISAVLNGLYLSLADRRLMFLERETDRARKPAIYEFPRELKRIRAPLVQFLIDVFRPNPLQPNPRLRGFYFIGTRKVEASAGMAASPALDRSVIHKVGDVTRILRAEDLQTVRPSEAQSGARQEITRWAFVSDLWQQLLRAGQGIAGPVSFNRREQFQRKVVFASVIAVSGIASILFLSSFLQNRSLVRDVQTAASQCEPVREGAAPSTTNLREIDALRSQLETLTNYHETRPPFSMRFGFYAGNRVLDPAREVYYRRFREYFLNPVVRRLEVELSTLPAGQDPGHPYEAVYASLKTYRTITKSAEKRCSPDAGLADRLLTVWSQGRETDDEAARIARANFQFYVGSLKANRVPEQFEVASKDQQVVQHARDYLSTFQGVDAQYHQIIDQVNQEMQSKARLIELDPSAGYRSVLRVQEEVPAAFTREGWNRVQALIKGAAGGNRADSCVLGGGALRLANPLAGSDMEAQLRALYVQDYIRRWTDFVAKASVLPYSGCGDAAKKLTVFQSNSSPVLAVLLMTAQNTTFPKHVSSATEQAGQAAKAAGKGLLERLRGRVGAVAPQALAPASPAQQAPVLTEDDITNAFQPARAVFAAWPPNLKHWPDTQNQAYLDALGTLQRAIQQLDKDGKCDDMNQAANNQANAEKDNALVVAGKLERNFDNQPIYGNVQSLLEAPIRGVVPLVNTDPSAAAKGKLNGAQKELCKALSGLKSKYPFNSQGEDASLDQVSKVFAAQGGQLALLEQALGDLAVKSGGGWIAKPDAPVKLRSDFLNFLNRMSAISAALFPVQGTAPGMHYKLLVRPNPGVRLVKGTLDGQEFSMAAKEYAWPSQNPQINLRLEQATGGDQPLRSYPGPWGIFELLSGADQRPGSNQFGLVNVQAGRRSSQQSILPDGSAIVLEVVQFPNGVQGAFEKNFFQVSCPAQVTE